MSFDKFDIEPEPACGWDFLEIVVPENETPRKLCGDSIPDPVTINSIGEVVFRFAADDLYVYEGFEARYRIDASVSGGVGAERNGKKLLIAITSTEIILLFATQKL